jgi:hypothetical protein
MEWGEFRSSRLMDVENLQKMEADKEWGRKRERERRVRDKGDYNNSGKG